MQKTILMITVAALAGCASTPKGPPVEGAVKWNGHWYAYFYLPNSLSWDEAKKYCENRGGHLACIETKSEWDFISESFAKKAAGVHFWLGATDQHKENDWRWINGVSLNDTFHNFPKGSPDNAHGGQDYLYVGGLSGGGVWDDHGDKAKFNGLICEWE